MAVGIIVAVVDGGDGVGGIIGGSVGNGDALVIGVGVGGDGGVDADGVGVNVVIGGSVVRNSTVGVGNMELLGVGAEVVIVGGGGVNVLTGETGVVGTHCSYRWRYCYW